MFIFLTSLKLGLNQCEKYPLKPRILAEILSKNSGDKSDRVISEDYSCSNKV
jgi:hypothetical protein